MGQFGIGQPVRRFEDKRLLGGYGRFQHDLSLLGHAYAYVLRAPLAHADIRGLDLTAAKAAPGVPAIYTGEDLTVACIRGNAKAGPAHAAVQTRHWQRGCQTR